MRMAPDRRPVDIEHPQQTPALAVFPAYQSRRGHEQKIVRQHKMHTRHVGVGSNDSLGWVQPLRGKGIDNGAVIRRA